MAEPRKRLLNLVYRNESEIREGNVKERSTRRRRVVSGSRGTNPDIQSLSVNGEGCGCCFVCLSLHCSIPCSFQLQK